MARILTLIHGVVSYAVFLATFVYAVGFLGNFGVPKSIDSPAGAPWTTALATNAALLTVFALQHSIMARQGFKRLLRRILPDGAERPTYVLASSLALLLLFWKWQPLGGVVWHVEDPVGRTLLYGAYAFGWALVLATTALIDHFDLFGLRQAWREFRGEPHRPLPFVTPLYYRLVRHPLYVGWIVTFWSTPTMTATHLFFAAVATAYILVAIQFEERDLMRAHPEYAEYRRRVPMLVPRLGRQSARAPEVTGAAQV